MTTKIRFRPRFNLSVWIVVAAGSTLAGGETVPAAARAIQGSAAFVWEDMTVKPTGVGERRAVMDSPTATLERLECHVSTLNPGRASHLPHTHPQEEMILLREGELDVHINGVVRRAGPGSVLFYASNIPHAVSNPGPDRATYLVINLTTAETLALAARPVGAPAEAGKLPSTVFAWDELPVKPTKAGQQRPVCNSPTTTLKNLECHVTTLPAGGAPHPSHHHPDEEIIAVKEGTIEVTIAGRTSRGGPGSVFFAGSNDEHGVKNVGDATATYYIIRFVTARTPRA